MIFTTDISSGISCQVWPRFIWVGLNGFLCAELHRDPLQLCPKLNFNPILPGPSYEFSVVVVGVVVIIGVVVAVVVIGVIFISVVVVVVVVIVVVIIVVVVIVIIVVIIV